MKQKPKSITKHLNLRVYLPVLSGKRFGFGVCPRKGGGGSGVALYRAQSHSTPEAGTTQTLEGTLF